MEVLTLEVLTLEVRHMEEAQEVLLEVEEVLVVAVPLVDGKSKIYINKKNEWPMCKTTHSFL